VCSELNEHIRPTRFCKQSVESQMRLITSDYINVLLSFGRMYALSISTRNLDYLNIGAVEKFKDFSLQPRDK
jgi:hypothetical protein